MKTQETNSQSEKGQSLLEFGISLVVLLVLVSGVIDLGRAFFTLITLHDAVQEGVTYAIICPTDTAGISSRLMESASDPVDLSNLTSGDIEVCVTTPGGNTCGAAVTIGNEVSVTANYDHEISTPFMGAILGTQNINLHATARDKIVRTDCQTTN
jgi:Flp pilus assembly protein TadG